jgi:hypothetical protein
MPLPTGDQHPGAMARDVRQHGLRVEPPAHDDRRAQGQREVRAQKAEGVK